MGINPVSTYAAPINTTQNATAYKANIDASINAFARVSDLFAPRQTTTPAMTISLDAGCVFSGTTLTEVASQTSGTITAPSSGNKRIDRAVINASTGVLSIITGTPTTGTPSAPAITSGNLPVAQISLLSTTTTITNSIITDERCLWGAPTPNSITNSQLAQMAALTIKGNNGGSSATPTDLNTAQAKTLLGVDSPVPVFPSTLSANWASNTTIAFTCSQLITQYNGNINDPFSCTGVSTATFNLGANWSGGGNLDTGSLAANTWYYGYVITTGSQQAGVPIWSTSSSAPTMPSGYYGCSSIVSCFRTDGSSHIIGFFQKGKDYQWSPGNNLSALPLLASGAQTTYVSYSWTAAAPAAIIGTLKLVLSVGANTGTIAMCAPNANYSLISSISSIGSCPPPLFVGSYPSQSGAGVQGEFMPETLNVYYACTQGSNALLSVLGFRINI